jgi:hypothetical protein
MKGWERVWGLIAAKYGNISCYQDGEAWQYMGTNSRHEFRHRNLKGMRLYEAFPIQNDDFEPVVKRPAECPCGINRNDCTYHR